MSEEIKAGALEFLFSEELYITNSPVVNTQKIEESTEKYSAVISSRIIVVHKGTGSLSPSDQEFLTKILSAAKVQDEYLLMDSSVAKSADLANQSAVQAVLCFGIKPFEIGFQNHTAGTYEVQGIAEKKILEIETLSTISVNNEKKKALWIALQRMFEL